MEDRVLRRVGLSDETERDACPSTDADDGIVTIGFAKSLNVIINVDA
jgi:hypothetical protein